MLGLFAFFYLSVHFSIYIALDNSFDLGFICEDIAERPYVTAGFTAFCLLVPLALTSTRGIRQRLGRHWQRLHRLVYPAAVAALLHFVWIQKADYREPLIYASVFLALMVVRSAWTGRLLTSLRTRRPLP
jgi:sulfoxide reductase heme-binding subunit YedZ